MTDRMQTIQGRCPACRGASLFLGDGGHVTCARLECPGPSAADDLLHNPDFLRTEVTALRDDLYGITGARWIADMLDTILNKPAPAAATQATSHRYLSTGCLHGQHDYCKNPTGQAGAKAPAQCKFCEAPCVCVCHKEQPDA